MSPCCWIIGLHLISTHLGDMNPGAERTLATPGVYVVAPNGITAGAYRNTLRRTSVHLGYTHALGGGWALSAGAVTGYPNTRTGYASEPTSKWPTPYLAASYTFGGGTGGRLTWMPVRTQPLSLAIERKLSP